MRPVALDLANLSEPNVSRGAIRVDASATYGRRASFPLAP